MDPNGPITGASPEQLDRKFRDGKSIPIVDEIDTEIRAQNPPILEMIEKQYGALAKQIVSVTAKELDNQSKTKKPLKKLFTVFFIVFISAQYLFLMALLCCVGFGDFLNFYIETEIISLYVTSVFLETLGAITIMITYAFNSKQEVKLIGILNNAISNYQKGNNDTHSQDNS